VPVYGLALSALVCCIAFLNISTSSKLVFGYFVNLVSIFGLLSWITILVSHIYFVRARKAQVRHYFLSEEVRRSANYECFPGRPQKRTALHVAVRHVGQCHCIVLLLSDRFDEELHGLHSLRLVWET